MLYIHVVCAFGVGIEMDMCLSLDPVVEWE